MEILYENCPMATNRLTLGEIHDFLDANGILELFNCIDNGYALLLTAKGLSLRFRIDIWPAVSGGFDWNYYAKRDLPGDINLVDPQGTNDSEIDDVVRENGTWRRSRPETFDNLVVALRFIRLGCERFHTAARFHNHIKHLNTRPFRSGMEPGTVTAVCYCSIWLDFRFLSRYSCRVVFQRCGATYDIFDAVKERMNGFEGITIDCDNEDQLFEEAKAYFVRVRELVLELHPPVRGFTYD